MEKIIEVGSISFFVVDSIYGEKRLSDEDAEILAKELENEIRDKFSKSAVSNFFTITSVEWKFGCFLETFYIGLISVAIWKVYKEIKEFLIDYPKIREGAIQFANDVKPYLYYKKKKSHHYVRPGSYELYDGEQIKKALEDLQDQEKK